MGNPGCKDAAGWGPSLGSAEQKRRGASGAEPGTSGAACSQPPSGAGLQRLQFPHSGRKGARRGAAFGRALRGPGGEAGMSEGAVLLESRSRTHGSQGVAGAFPREGVPPWGGAGRPERGGWLPGQACTKQGWLRNRSGGQLPPGRGGRSSSRRWKARPRPQLWLQLLQPDQGARPQSTAGTGGPGSEGGSRGSGPSPGSPPIRARPNPAPTTAVLVRAVVAVRLQVAALLGGQTLPTAAGQLARRAEAPGGRQPRQGGGGHGEGHGARCPCWGWGRAREPHR